MPPPLPPPRRAVQLAPSSLALVLRRRERGEAGCEEEEEEAAAEAVFGAFRRANAACPWDAGLARAVARVGLQGWLRGGVLLLQGPAAPLQRVRDAWLRRALRPPQGFLIKAVGDVSPVHMNPILQSQFVPLAEVLCCTISDMNEAHVTVTQETLLDQLGKHYPGIATPTHDILYNTLGILIKERKIYHTGEGYFIVTPNTYFISNNAVKNNKRVLLEDVGPRESSITYLVSMEDSTELVKEDFPVASHCRSCHCFPDHTGVGEPQQLSSHKVNGKSKKGSCESRLSVQNPATNTLPGSRSCETSHSSHSAKEKDKGKKFGLNFFWRNTSKKEKPRKVYCSFSAQFPPEEWPVRDEDSLDKIPRDVEHEIIKRINPVLTVDNLIKHTALMRKIEEEKKYISKGTSTEVLTVKHKHLPKGCVRKKHSKAAKHRRKAQSGKEKQVRKPSRDFKMDDLIPANGKLGNCVEHPSSCMTNEYLLCDKQLCENATEAEACFILKKEITNPFQDILRRGNKSTKGHKSRKYDYVKSAVPRLERNFLQSHSLDSSETIDCKTKQWYAIKCGDEGDRKEHLAADCSSFHYVADHCAEHSDRSQYRALQTGGEYGSLGESMAYKHNSHNGPSPKTYAALLDGSEMKSPQDSSRAHQCGKAGLCSLQDQNSGQLRSVCFPSDTEAAPQLKPSENVVMQRRDGDLKMELQSSNASTWHGSVNPQCKGCSYDKPVPYPKGQDADGCSSLHRDSEEQLCKEVSELPSNQSPFSSSDPGRQNDIKCKQGNDMLRSRSINSHFPGHGTDTDQVDSWGHEGDEFFSITRSNKSSKEYQKTIFEGESCVVHQTSKGIYKSHEEGMALGGHGQPPETANTLVLNCCDLHEAEARTWQESVNEVDGKLASLPLPFKGREVKMSIVERPQTFGDAASAVDQCPQREQNHLEGTGSHSITGDSGIDSPRDPPPRPCLGAVPSPGPRLPPSPGRHGQPAGAPATARLPASSLPAAATAAASGRAEALGPSAVAARVPPVGALPRPPNAALGGTSRRPGPAARGDLPSRAPPTAGPERLQLLSQQLLGCWVLPEQEWLLGALLQYRSQLVLQVCQLPPVLQEQLEEYCWVPCVPCFNSGVENHPCFNGRGKSGSPSPLEEKECSVCFKMTLYVCRFEFKCICLKNVHSASDEWNPDSLKLILE
uniref:storkhead-box protein 1 n=1 Tax=Euleptes europaea TaxID=460621 RepID=UPI00253F9E92|nr:storkhead-box protein 1 [Euleptes europaea]